MSPAVESMVAVSYVRDIDVTRPFYELLGFREVSSGRTDAAAWSALRQSGARVLLAWTKPPLGVPPFPLMFYFFFDDLGTVVATLAANNVEFDHMGHPPHALGGEVKLLDPDGNTVLIGQEERSPTQAPPAGVEGGGGRAPRFSLLREAAAMVKARGGTNASCQVGDLGGPCPNLAEVRLADLRGDTAWACLTHAGEVLVAVRGAFIASHREQGIASFVASRQN